VELPTFRVIKQDVAGGLIFLANCANCGRCAKKRTAVGQTSAIGYGTVPTLRNLSRIAMVFSKDLSYFFETEPQALFRVHRRKERVRLPQTGVEVPAYFFESLGYMVPDRQMDPYFAEFVPLAKARNEGAYAPGRRVSVCIGGGARPSSRRPGCNLEAGDAVYFDASTPHSYQCAGKKPAGAIIVTMHQTPQGCRCRRGRRLRRTPRLAGR